MKKIEIIIDGKYPCYFMSTNYNKFFSSNFVFEIKNSEYKKLVKLKKLQSKYQKLLKEIYKRD